RAVGALRGDQLPGPDGLQRLVADFGQATGTPSHFEVSGVPTSLAPEAQLALYRTAQEALTNVRKHAHATEVTVRLHYTDDGAELVVEDAAPVRNGTRPEVDRAAGVDDVVRAAQTGRTPVTDTAPPALPVVAT